MIAAMSAVAAPSLGPGAQAPLGATPLPAHVYAPHFEPWTADGLTATAQASGARYFTLAFLETLSKTSCSLAWDGDRAQPLSAGKYLADIAQLRAMGGDVIPSFG